MEDRTPHFPYVATSLSGVLIVAHPHLVDPNFRRTVVLVSAHSEDEGTVGTIINRPMKKTLGEFDPAFSGEPLGRVSLYRGGPVAADELIFMAWKWADEEGVFRLVYGIDLDQARVLLEETGYEVRAFLGYAGWGRGQLEEELAHDSWVISAVENQGWLDGDEQNLWRNILGRISPAMKIQAEAPEDPSLN